MKNIYRFGCHGDANYRQSILISGECFICLETLTGMMSLIVYGTCLVTSRYHTGQFILVLSVHIIPFFLAIDPAMTEC